MMNLHKLEKSCEKVKLSYKKPEIMIFEFESEDIITTSSGTLDSADITGGLKDFIGSWFSNK